MSVGGGAQTPRKKGTSVLRVASPLGHNAGRAASSSVANSAPGPPVGSINPRQRELEIVSRHASSAL
jgi:hypothetical protein